jgi:flagellar hook-associated protein 3 FlgL
MRVSTRMFQDSALRSVRANLETLSRLQDQVATGLRVRTVSDDPAAATQIMRTDAEVRDFEQFQANGTQAATRLNTEDAVLTSARDLLAQARSLAIGVAGRDPADPQRQAMVAAVEQLRQELVSYGNTRVGSEFIFGGASTTTPPFQADGTYVGDDVVQQVEIDRGVFTPTNHIGDSVFSSALQGLADLEQQLQTGNQASIDAVVSGLQDAGDQMVLAQSETGTRLQQISAAKDSLAQRTANLLDQRDGLRNADPSEVSIKVVAAQSALERAYAAIGKVLSTNLLDYLS